MDNLKLTLDINHHSKVVTLGYRLYYPNGDCQQHNFNGIFSHPCENSEELAKLLSIGELFNFCEGYIYGLPNNFVTMPGPMSKQRAYLIPKEYVTQFPPDMFGQDLTYYQGVPENYHFYISQLINFYSSPIEDCHYEEK